jgi:hypothetical protein
MIARFQKRLVARLKHSKRPDWSREDLTHVIPHGPAVYLALGDRLTRERFERALAVLASRDATPLSQDTVNVHWKALEKRWTGTRRWDVVVPREDARMVLSLKSREAFLEHR